MIKTIQKQALALGACQRSTEATDWRSMAWLLFSPQGREFCGEHNFPSVKMWDNIRRECDTTQYGIYVDTGETTIQHNQENVALIGRTHGYMTFDTPAKCHRVIVQHGAKATITATNYAVVLVVKIGRDCDVTINKDETSTILW